jgi:hypothetical protein
MIYKHKHSFMAQIECKSANFITDSSRDKLYPQKQIPTNEN